jgi:hypothetical protein
MSVTVWLSKNLSRITKGTEGFEVDGQTVGECLDDLTGIEPILKGALFYGSRLHPKIEVLVNNKTVDKAECLAKNVRDGDEVDLRGH